jgi:hypothetical protein
LLYNGLTISRCPAARRHARFIVSFGQMLADEPHSSDRFGGLRLTAEHGKIFTKHEARLIAAIEQSRRAWVKSGHKDPVAIVELVLKDEQLTAEFDEVTSQCTLAGLSQTPAHHWLGSIIAKLVIAV